MLYLIFGKVIINLKTVQFLVKLYSLNVVLNIQVLAKKNDNFVETPNLMAYLIFLVKGSITVKLSTFL